MKLRIILMIICVWLTFEASAQYSFPACATPWVSGTSYTQGNQVSHQNANYQAKYYTTAEPGTNGDWAIVSKCGEGGLGPDYAGPQRVIGYLPYWVPDFNLQAFDPGTVSNVVVAFNLFQQNNNNYGSSDFGSIAWGAFHKHKVDSVLFDNGVLSRAHAKGVKVSVAIGGATDYAFLWLLTQYYNNDAKLEEMANFITGYVNTTGIDGIDLDLECWWPDATIAGTTEQGGRVRGDKWGGPDSGPHPACVGLTRLAQKLKAKMPSKLLSCAVFGTAYYGNNYDDAIAQYADWVGLMTYDFTGSWNTSPIGPHSSLYKVPLNTYQGQTADSPILSAQDALEYWMGMAEPAWNHDGGFAVPKAKLCIGVPFYGYDLATRKPNNANGFVALKWKEIVAAYPTAPSSYDPLDTRQLGGFIGANGKKIYYETPKGAAEKIKYTKTFGHQGVIMWELTGDTPYSGGSSLLKAINDAAGIVVNPPPTASITSPANNSVFAPGASITVNAAASDNGSVTKVEFFQGSTKLGEDLTSPYSYVWPGVSAGSYVLTVKATDNQSAATVSNSISITVGNALPLTSISSPANGSTFAVGSTITINATASDADGTIAKVDFYNGATLLGTDTSSPYSYNWGSVTTGSYSLSTKVTDNLGGVGSSSIINISVGNSLPTVSITSPSNNSSFNAPAAITINANATDSDGSISKVDFYNGSNLLGTDTTSPFSLTWSNVTSGSYSLTAKATDNVNGITTSAIVAITVSSSCTTPSWDINTPYNSNTEVSKNGNKYLSKWWTKGEDPELKSGPDDVWKLIGTCGANANPVTSITSPLTGASFTSPTSITISAVATDSDGSVTKVDFYSGSTLLGTDTTSPFSFNWPTVAIGSYSLTTKATDNNGGIGVSATILITVNGDGNVIPTISLTSPSNNSSFTAPASIILNAAASDQDGTISKVDFYNGSTLLGSDNTSPYTLSWTSVPAGNYSLTAKAIDNVGSVGTSSVINIIVSGSTGTCSGKPTYSENGGYVAGSQVQNFGNLYECKPYPYTGWCNGASWAYAPGTGSNWSDAWVLKGSCSGGRLSTQNEPLIENGEADLIVSPNPALSGTLVTIRFATAPGNIRIRLSELQGTDLANNNFTGVKDKIEVNVPNVKAGLYVFRISNGQTSWTRKLIIK